MPAARRRDLAPEIVEGLNQDLEELRGLYIPKDTALEGLYKATTGIKKDFDKASTGGEVPERDPSREEQLVKVASSIPGILEQQAAFGSRATAFVDKLQGLLTTRLDGTVITSSLNPLSIHAPKPKRYAGDYTDVPRIYLTSDDIEGRVTDTGALGSDSSSLLVDVWPTGVKVGKHGDWHNGNGGNPSTFVCLLDESVQFVEHVEGCKLPQPDQYQQSAYASAGLL